MKLRVERVKNLKSAILQNKISEIGKSKEETRKSDLNADRKRFWLGKLASLENNQFNVSMPLRLIISISRIFSNLHGSMHFVIGKIKHCLLTSLR